MKSLDSKLETGSIIPKDCSMIRVSVTRRISIPDQVKLARSSLNPAIGPAILFFSGGTALRQTSRYLIKYTHNSIHIITPFDSGGSSAKLRAAFEMPAIGDMRNRLMALADQSFLGYPEIFALFAHRFPKTGDNNELVSELKKIARGKHPLISRVPDPMRKIIRNSIYRFLERMPPDFDLTGASIGNLVLTAGYLDNRRHLDPVIFIFSKLVNVRGTVRPVLNNNLHLAARLADGTVVTGQHKITGKEQAPLKSPVKEIYLCKSLTSHEPVEAAVRAKTVELIKSAELICYPMGSFYTSLIANLLPKGVNEAIAANQCPKIYIPSTGNDPETLGQSLTDQVRILLQYLLKDAPEGTKTGDLLNFVLVDSKNGVYNSPVDAGQIEALGVKVVDMPLVSGQSAPEIDPQILCEVLLSFA
ncbi:MAG: GAK system CofD-like protein [Desulfatibacillaceae bacterium]|nr:GAK system CofD-like protein [Desulfatibacillaceae bacterium]